ncbi:MAG: DUF4230 domain-containing protein [Bacteroides sp.]|nr:DUF4230 domain-containing protein [Bacteroides sp.]
MRKTAIRILLGLTVIAAIGGAVWYITHKSGTPAPEVEPVEMRDARITAIAPMLRLCSLEFTEDIPVKGNVGKRHLMGRATVRGSISFDLDSVASSMRGDTLVVTLPREIVEILESTDPGSYEVIDTWNDALFGSSRFTTAEENAIKEKARADFRRRLYSRGTVRRARAEAAANLRSLLAPMSGGPVTVEDPTPDPRP